MRPIDADALIEKFAKWREELQNEREDEQGDEKINIEGAIEALECCIAGIESTPTIEAEPVKHGRWIQLDRDIAVCSECGRHENALLVDSYPYCHCGAKMDGGK